MSSDEGSVIKEQALHPEQAMRRTDENEKQKSATEYVLDERIRRALLAASDKKAVNPVLLDLQEIASFTDYFVITSGSNVRQVQAIADAIVEQLKLIGERAARVEGYSTAEWVLVDYGDFIVHVFEEKARQFYDLERLWREAKRIPLPPELGGPAEKPGAGQ